MTVRIYANECLPASEAARQLGTTETRILMLLKQKALEGELVEGSWFVTVSSLAAFDPTASEAQKQPGCSTSCSASSCGCH